jgi:uncharacterized membrane protein
MTRAADRTASQRTPAAGDASEAARFRLPSVPLALSTLAAAGVGISSYLTIVHYGKKEIACAGLGQCDYVNSSQYASVLGIPVSVLGLLMYGALLAAALAWLARPRSETLPVVYWGLALAGAGYAGYLTYIELAVLHAICIWCVASAIVLATSLALSSAVLLRES